MAKILVVDDEKIIVKGIRFSLLQDQMEVGGNKRFYFRDDAGTV